MGVSEDILAISKKTRDTAKRLISEKNVLEILSKFGEPKIIGSYEMDLMLDEDIDIVVKTDNPKKSAIEALNKFIELETVQKYEFGDFVTYPRKNRPNSYIVNLRLEYENAKWEFEIWFFKEIESQLEQLNEIKSKINEKNRLRILEMKYERRFSGQSKHEKSSMEIYNEVLN